MNLASVINISPTFFAVFAEVSKKPTPKDRASSRPSSSVTVLASKRSVLFPISILQTFDDARLSTS